MCAFSHYKPVWFTQTRPIANGASLCVFPHHLSTSLPLAYVYQFCFLFLHSHWLVNYNFPTSYTWALLFFLQPTLAICYWAWHNITLGRTLCNLYTHGSFVTTQLSYLGQKFIFCHYGFIGELLSPFCQQTYYKSPDHVFVFYTTMIDIYFIVNLSISSEMVLPAEAWLSANSRTHLTISSIPLLKASHTNKKSNN